MLKTAYFWLILHLFWIFRQRCWILNYEALQSQHYWWASHCRHIIGKCQSKWLPFSLFAQEYSKLLVDLDWLYLILSNCSLEGLFLHSDHKSSIISGKVANLSDLHLWFLGQLFGFFTCPCQFLSNGPFNQHNELSIIVSFLFLLSILLSG